MSITLSLRNCLKAQLDKPNNCSPKSGCLTHITIRAFAFGLTPVDAVAFLADGILGIGGSIATMCTFGRHDAIGNFTFKNLSSFIFLVLFCMKVFCGSSILNQK